MKLTSEKRKYMEDFTPEEREYIDSELALVEEEQKLNGNKLYPFDEFMANFMRDLEIEEKEYRI